METSKKSGDVQLSRLWVEARSGTQRATLPLSPGVVDPLSLNMVVMRDLQRDRLPKQYTLVDETALRTFQIRNEGEEVLDTPLGRLRTLRISHSKPGNTRITTFWFAPELRYLPVRIAQHKKGEGGHAWRSDGRAPALMPSAPRAGTAPYAESIFPTACRSGGQSHELQRKLHLLQNHPGYCPAIKVCEDEYTPTFMDINPASPGHALVTSRRTPPTCWRSPN
ncbi:MAG: DUF3108 domain-containing protein [Candidatus Competibacteraceae bacterium]